MNHSLRGEQLPRVYDFHKKSSHTVQNEPKINEPVTVAEPETLVLLAAGLVLIAWLKRKV